MVCFIEKIGPAILDAKGDKYWFINGKTHRIDGPAVVWSNGYKSWVLNDKVYGYDNDFTNDSWSKFVKTLIFS